MATDPVCGMKVDPGKPGATAEHAGKKYFFCCSHCAAKFQADPEKYLQPATDPVCGMKVEPANAAAEIAHAGRTYYFCSTQCAQKFNADPARYVGNSGPGPQLPHSATHGIAALAPNSGLRPRTYTCPTRFSCGSGAGGWLSAGSVASCGYTSGSA